MSSPPVSPSTRPSGERTAQERAPARDAWVTPVLVAGIGLFLSVLDQTVTGVAYGAIQKEFGGNNVDIQWVTTGYRLGQGVVVPLAIWSCRRYGLRPMYLLSLVMYAVTSALCAGAHSLPSLVVYRVLQGIPGGLAAIVSIAVVGAVLPPQRQAVGQAVLMSVVLSAPGLSPAIGGFLVEHLSWRLNFFITVPFAVVGFVLTFVYLPNLPGGAAHRFDWGGFLCIGTALACLLLATSKGSDWGWTSYVILILFAVAVDALVLFVIIERQVDEPLMDLRLFASQPFVLGCALVIVVIVGLSATPSFLPQYLQQVQAMTPTGSGLALVPQALTLMAAIPVAGLLMARIGTRWLMVIGLVVLACGSLYLNRLSDGDVPRSLLVAVLAVRSFGLGLALVPVLGATIAVLPPSLIADGIAFRTLFQRIAPEVVLLFLTAYAQHRQKQLLNDRSQLLDPAHAPALSALGRTDQSALLPLYEKQQGYDLGASYGEVFQIVGVIVLVGIVLALVARWGEKLPTEQDVMENGA